MVRVGFLSAILLLCVSSSSNAQGVNVMARSVSSTNETQISLPAGASGGVPVTDKADTGAGGRLGVQIAKTDDFHFALFFNYATRQTISGDQKAFGAAVLNPATEGLGFYASANKWFQGGIVGIGGEGGFTSTAWQGPSGTQSVSVDASILYYSVMAQVATKTMPYGDGNFLKIGGGIGYGGRTIAGDMSLSQFQAFRMATLGIPDTSVSGLELTLFGSFNDVQPFGRITHYTTTTDVLGLSGWQAFVGVNVLSPVFKNK